MKRPRASTRRRCRWAEGDPLLTVYHDEEWGRPVHDDRRHFEFLVLEAAQAGLSWLTVLRKRDGYRRAFADFDPRKVARFSAAKIDRLVQDPSIIRNRKKIEAAVHNAREFLKVQREFGSFDAYCWGFVGGAAVCNHPKTTRDIPATSAHSDALSKDLKRRGFKFVGSTVIYAHMQAVGMIDDHVVDCFRHRNPRRRSLQHRDPQSPDAAAPTRQRKPRGA